MTEKAKAKAVYVIKENGDKQSFWTKVGVAFVNRDESLSVQLDSLPIDGKLHIRDFKKQEEKRS